LNVWIPVPEETAAVAALAQEGWAVRAGERYRLRSGPAVRITVAALAPRDAARLAAARSLRPPARRASARTRSPSTRARSPRRRASRAESLALAVRVERPC
jgi:hypothetical protein